MENNPPNQGQHSARKVIRRQPSATPYAKAIVYYEISAFNAVFDSSTVEAIAIEVNHEGGMVLVYGDNFQATFIADIKAFVELCLLCGVYESHMESIEELFSEEHGGPIFHKTMTLTRFKMLRQMLRFDNRITRNARLHSDRFAAVHPLMA